MVKNAHLACSEAFDVQLKSGRPSKLVDDAFDALPVMKKEFATYKALPAYR